MGSINYLIAVGNREFAALVSDGVAPLDVISAFEVRFRLPVDENTVSESSLFNDGRGEIPNAVDSYFLEDVDAFAVNGIVEQRHSGGILHEVEISRKCASCGYQSWCFLDTKMDTKPLSN